MAKKALILITALTLLGVGGAAIYMYVNDKSRVSAKDSEKSFQSEEPDQVLAHIKRKIQGDYEPHTEKRLAHQLLKIVRSGKKENTVRAMFLLEQMQKNIQREYPKASAEELKKAERSVGVWLLNRNGNTEDEAIKVLIREARLLSTPAHIMLKKLYKYKVKGIPRHDRRILDFFKESAEKGLKASQVFMGRIYMNGWGIKTNRSRAIQYFKQAGTGDAFMALARDAKRRNMKKKFRKYLQQAAKQEVPAAYYNLGIIEQKKGRESEAIRLFRRTLEKDKDYYPACLELGRMLVEHRESTEKQKRGVALMRRVAQNAEGREKAIAHANLGIFYKSGLGVEKSLSRARKELEKAAEGGVTQAKKLLKEIELENSK